MYAVAAAACSTAPPANAHVQQQQLHILLVKGNRAAVPAALPAGPWSTLPPSPGGGWGGLTWPADRGCRVPLLAQVLIKQAAVGRPHPAQAKITPTPRRNLGEGGEACQ